MRKPRSLGRARGLTRVAIGLASLVAGILAVVAVTATILATLSSSIAGAMHSVFLVAWLTIGPLVLVLLAYAVTDGIRRVGRRDGSGLGDRH